MASFNIDITNIVLGRASGVYQDILLTSRPSEGIDIGTPPAWFGITVVTSGISYRISSLSQNSGEIRTGTVRIYNHSDHSDYIDITVTQCNSDVNVVGVEGSDNVFGYNKGVGYEADFFAEYNASSSDIITVYVNNPNRNSIGDSWIHSYEQYTLSTGITRYKYTLDNNLSTFRSTTISYDTYGSGLYYVTIRQNGYPSGSSGCTSPISFPREGGTARAELKTTYSASSVYANTNLYHTGEGYLSDTSMAGSGTLYTTLTAASNTTSEVQRHTVLYTTPDYFGDYIDLGFTNTTLGVGAPQTLRATPSSLTFTSESDWHTVIVSYAGTLTTNASSAPSWVNISEYISNAYRVGVSEFLTTGSSRSWNWELADDNMSLAVPIVQNGPEEVTLSISPSSGSVSSESGYVEITVTATGMTPQYSITGAFISYNGQSGNVYRFDYTRNTTSVQRQGTITFYGGGLSETYTLTQAAPAAPVLTVSPSSQNVTADTGQVNITVTYSGLGGAPTATSSDNWLGVGSISGSSYIIWYSQNTGTARTGTITFTGGGLTETFTLNQAATTLYITVTPSTKNLTSEAGTFALTVDTNVSSVSVSVNTGGAGPWLEYTNSGSGGIYNFSYTANTGQVDRSALIRFSGDNISADCYVEQERTLPAAIWVSPSTGSVSSSSGSVTVAVTTQNVSTVTPTISGSWITQGTISGDDYTYDYTSNTSSASRTGIVTFSGNGASATYTLTQEGYVAPSPILSVTPTSDSVTSSSGTVTITLRTQNVTSVTYSSSYPWIHYVSGSESNIYVFSYDANSGAQRTGTITFTATGPGGSVSKSYTLTQAGSSTPVLVIDPTTQTVDYHTRAIRVTVYTENIDTVTYNIQDTSWLHFSSIPSPGQYSFTVDENTGSSSRTNTVTFTGGGLSRTYTLTQTGTGEAVLAIDPTTQTVDYHMRAVRVTVYTENIDTVSYNIEDTSWLQFSSIPSPGQYSFIVNENTGSSSRTNTVTFTGGGLSRTYTLTQTGTTPPTPPTPSVSGLKTSPESLRYYSTSSRQTVSFNMPVDEVTYSITYTEGQDWLSTSTAQNGINFTASVNAGNKRSATIRFYEIADPTNYVDVPVIQGSGTTYWDSIWVENIFTPNVQDDYHYNIMISNPHFSGSFEGLTPIPYQGIDVPRLVEDYISSSFEPQVGLADWASMYTGYCMASIYNLNGSTPVLEGTYSFWNDWSGKEKRYDYTKSINDPINHKGTSGMIIPFCVYADSNDNPLFSTLVTDMEGNTDTNTYSTPLEPFNMRTDVWYNVKNVDYKLDGQVLFSYDMTHCGDGAFIYRNRFGGWDSFLIEGNISKTDNYTKLNYKTKGIYNSNISNGYNYNEKRTSDVDIDTTYEAYTGWLTDDEAERLVFHLASSPKVYFQDLVNPSSDLIPIRMTLANAEYKKFRNGRRLVNYTILFEKAYTEKLKD